MSDSNKLVLTAIIGVFVGLVLGRLLWYTNVPSLVDEEQTPEETETVSGLNEEKPQTDQETPATKPAEGNRVSAANQPAGNSVQVSVVADQTVWVEVRDNNSGVMGKVLGAKHVDAGEAVVTVPLQRATEKGKSYFVALAPYNNGVLDYSVSAVMKEALEPVANTFVAE